MNGLAHLILVGWVPLGLLAFQLLPPRRAAFLLLAAGWMFLPELSIPLPGLPNFGKSSAISYSLILGVLLFDAERLRSFRPHVIDVAFAAWLLASPISSISNGLGSYDAASAFLTRAIDWGIPYFIGTLYLRTPEGLRDFLWTMFLSGLIYMPLALYEVRMSPQLHRIVYGMSQHGFEQTMRGGGWRPMVFMRHGLELSLWMAASTLAGFALWRFQKVKQFFGVPMGALVAAVGVTLLLCKSTGAILLCAIAMLLIAPRQALWPRRVLMAMIPVYVALRLFGDGQLEELLLDLSRNISDDRAGSLEFRINSERLLIGNSWHHPVFGAGGWNFGVVADLESGESQDVTVDSLWIITLATNGLFGLSGLLLSLWGPALRGMTQKPKFPALFVGSMILSIVFIDSLVNAFVPPIYIALAGGLAHFSAPRRQRSIRARAAPQPARRPQPLRPRWRGEPSPWPFA